MEAINFLRSILEKHRKHRFVPKIYAEELLQARNAVKFILPKEGKIFNTGFKGLPDKLRLPYPKIVLEFDRTINEVQREVLVGEGHLLNVPEEQAIMERLLVIVSQEGEGVINLRQVSLIKGSTEADDIWSFLPAMVSISPERGVCNGPGDTGMYVVSVTSDIPDTGDIDRETLNAGLSIVIGPATVALCELIEALACRNVKPQALPVRKVGKSSKKKGALTFDEYHVLTVDVNRGSGSTGTGAGERRSPREHLRRGHIRRYASGVNIWIQSTVIGAGSGGMIVKDYRVKKERDHV